MPIAGERLEQGDLCCWGTDGKIYKLRSVQPLDNNSIPAGFAPIESEGDVNPIAAASPKNEPVTIDMSGVSWFAKSSGQFDGIPQTCEMIRSKPFMQSNSSQDYEGQER